MRTLTDLITQLNAAHAKTGSWSKASVICKVLTESGEPDRGLAYRIAMQGYEPRTVKVCQRLHIPAYCQVCERPAPRHKPKPPAWVTQAADILAARYAPVIPTGPRCYTRQGKLYREDNRNEMQKV